MAGGFSICRPDEIQRYGNSSLSPKDLASKGSVLPTQLGSVVGN